MVISLKNRPNGGEPVTITADEHEQRARDRRAAERARCPIPSKSDELCSCASVPAEKSATGLASEW